MLDVSRWRWGCSGITPSTLSVAGVLLVTACGASSPAPAVERISALSQVPDRPISRYLPAKQQLLSIQRQQTLAINECLRSRGITAKVSDDPVSLNKFVDILVSDRKVRTDIYGLFDPESAPHYGYASPDESARRFQPTVPAAVPTQQFHECWQEAEDFGRGLSVVMEESGLPEGGPESATETDEVQAAWKEWAECMDKFGFAYRSPVDALRDRAWALDEGVSTLEIKVATADMSCKRATNLVGKTLAAQMRLDEEYVKAKGDELEGLTYEWPTPS